MHALRLATACAEDAPHQKAFAAYLRSGDDDGLRGLDMEGKALATSIAADGGYLVDPQTADRFKARCLDGVDPCDCECREC